MLVCVCVCVYASHLYTNTSNRPIGAYKLNYQLKKNMTKRVGRICLAIQFELYIKMAAGSVCGRFWSSFRVEWQLHESADNWHAPL